MRTRHVSIKKNSSSPTINKAGRTKKPVAWASALMWVCSGQYPEAFVSGLNHSFFSQSKNS